MSGFHEYGPKLFELGYEIVPIPRGLKYPPITNWQKVPITAKLLNTWDRKYPDAGVGVRCATCPAIDIDVYDKKIANKLARWLKNHLDDGGLVVERIGEAPKILFPCQTDKPFRKKYSSTYKDPLGVEHKIEFLGAGQQFVAFHVHPDTGKDYYYPSAKTLAEVPREALPTITPKLIKELIAYFDEIAPDDWHQTEQARTNGKTSATGLMALAPKVDLTKKEIKKLLKRLGNDDRYDTYDVYVRVGMGLHHQFDGSEKGLELWNWWCSKSEKYDEATNRVKWKSFGGDNGGAQITFASTIKLARDKEADAAKKALAGEQEVPEEAADLRGFLKRYAYVPEDNQILDIERPLEYALMPIASFKNLTANRLTDVPAPTAADPDKVKRVPTSSLWLTNAKRLTVEGTTYRPESMKKIVRTKDGRLLANVAHFPAHEKTYKEQTYETDGWRLNIFNNHMEYLFPDAKQRLWFLQWLAWNIQYPAKRCKVTPLHVSTEFGTGRGWVVSLIEKLLGTWNVTKTTIAEMCGEGSRGQYDDYLHRSLVCAVEEVHASDKRYSVSDALRDKLTENRLNVNLKYAGKATIDVFTNFFWMTNHADAMVIPKRDRRIHVLQGPDHVQSGEYYDELYRWLESPENVAFVWKELLTIDLTGFEWKVAPETTSRERMVEYTRTASEDVFTTWLSENKNKWMLFEDIHEAVGEIAQRDGVTELMSPGQIRKLLQQNCYQHPQMRFTNGTSRRVRPWYCKGKSDPGHSLDSVRKALKKQHKN